VLSDGPPVMIFDEVDAGIGGAAALAVGRALSAVATRRQVFVVTHLAQVAAWADSQVVVDKVIDGSTTSTIVVAVDGTDRVTELARMLSGTPESATAQQHARELLTAAHR
jgi:DNA repair protein RecN (Recombination protein N)